MSAPCNYAVKPDPSSNPERSLAATLFPSLNPWHVVAAMYRLAVLR